MYLGKYPEALTLPPGYHGVALSAEGEHDRPPEEPPAACADPHEKESVCEADPSCTSGHGGRGLLDHIFSHKLDVEDLLLLALIVMVISSGADLETVLMLALLFVFGL